MTLHYFLMSQPNFFEEKKKIDDQTRDFLSDVRNDLNIMKVLMQKNNSQLDELTSRLERLESSVRRIDRKVAEHGVQIEQLLKDVLVLQLTQPK